jgi:4-aminobutyrate aminotransferase-like enzyme
VVTVDYLLSHDLQADADRIGKHFAGRGVLGNVLRITPPMSVTEEDADEVLSLLHEVLSVVNEAVRNKGENR